MCGTSMGALSGGSAPCPSRNLHRDSRWCGRGGASHRNARTRRAEACCSPPQGWWCADCRGCTGISTRLARERKRPAVLLSFEGVVGMGEPASSSSTGSTRGVLGSTGSTSSSAASSSAASSSAASSATASTFALETRCASAAGIVPEAEDGACEKMAKARITYAGIVRARGRGCCCGNGSSNRPSSAWEHTPDGRCPSGTKRAFFAGGGMAA